MALTTTIFTSLDNRVHADSDWQYPWFDAEYFEVVSRVWNDADAFLIGAQSFAGYEKLTQAFPDSPIVGNLRAKPTYVVSSTRRTSASHPDAVWLPDASAQTIDDLQRRHPNVVILGSASLVVSLLESGVLRRLSVAVFPTVVGTGRSLWDTASQPLSFSAASSRTLDNGITLFDLDL